MSLKYAQSRPERGVTTRQLRVNTVFGRVANVLLFCVSLDIFTIREALTHLEEVCAEIFEEQLDSWYRVPSSWPVNQDFDTFKRWFEYRFHSMLVDLCEDPLEHDEL